MDQRERWEDIEEAIRVAIESMQRSMWTALPGVIQSFNADQGTVSVQPSIMAQIRQRNGTNQKIVNVALPVLINCPVQAPGGGGFVMTYPITAGDECLIVFASRCIDAWWQQSGVQPQLEYRMHNLSDGFAIPGFRSVPKAIPSWNTTEPELRSTDGTSKITMHVAGGVTITPKSGQKVRIIGDLEVTGTIIAGHGTGDQIGLQTHRHAQGNDSNGDAELPTNAPTPGT